MPRDAKGRFAPGWKGGPGRPRKKIPAELHQKTLELVEDLVLDILSSQDSLTTTQKIDVATKLMPFVLPRLSAMEANFDITLPELMQMSAEERKLVYLEYQKQQDNGDE